jgi:CSLREA domain-containing protein
MKIRVFLSGLILAVVSLCVMAAAATAATTYTVTTTADTDSTGTGACATGGACTLREALNAVNAGAGGDTVIVPAGVYTLNPNSGFGVLLVNKSVTITGAGAASTILDGNHATEIMSVAANPVSISGVTMRNGVAPGNVRGGAMIITSAAHVTLNSDVLTGNSAGTPGSGAGGAIENEGTLAITNSTLSNNTAGSYGGAINNEESQGAKSLTITQSTFSGNQAENPGGGAISIDASSALPALTVTQSVFTSNATTSGGNGGAIRVSTFGGSPPPVQIKDSTFTGNHAGQNGGALSDGQTGSVLTNDTLDGNSASGSGGNINDIIGTPTLRNTIVAAGSASSSTSANCDGHVISKGHNLENANTCGFTGTGDKVNTNPKLGSLAGNGGPTRTMALNAGSPAINAGTNTGCPSTDQRGVARPQGTRCDIGAYEAAPPSASTGAATGIGTTSATLNGTVANPDAVAATVTFKYGTTTSYGSTVTESAAAFSGQTASTAALSSLAPNTTYHYQVVVTNPDGTATGQDQTFTTANTPPGPNPPSNNFSVGKRHVFKTGKITIKLTAPDAGSFKGKATFKAHHRKFVYGKGSTSVSGAGTVTLTIKLGRHARKELLKVGHARVSIVITFSPTGGTSATKTITLKVKVRHGHFRL